MKLVAASQIGAKKDFIDLYVIEKSGLPISSLLELLRIKFPEKTINFYHIVKSLVFFDDAELEPMPRMLHEIDWNGVKEFFINNQKELLRAIPE